ncbi:MAG TPA: matrixin family metalloprotease [bacterium]|nr:matrixin family metalloprotease [bacterium]
MNKCVLKADSINGKKSSYQGDIEEPRREIIERKYKWKRTTVTWKIIHASEWFEDTPDAKFDFEWKAARTAFRVWQNRVKDIVFKYERDPNKRADIEITFTKDDPLWADGKKGTLAYAYFPVADNDQFTLAGDMFFNDWIEWTKDGAPYDKVNPDGSISKVKTYLLVHTLVHEIGHAIGLKHSNGCRECVMYPYYNEVVILARLDIDRAQSFYGISTKSQRFINYFRDRLLRGIIR